MSLSHRIRHGTSDLNNAQKSDFALMVEAAIQLEEAIGNAETNLAQLQTLWDAVQATVRHLAGVSPSAEPSSGDSTKFIRIMVDLGFFIIRSSRWNVVAQFWHFNNSARKLASYHAALSTLFGSDENAGDYDIRRLNESKTQDENALNERITRVIGGILTAYSTSGLMHGSEGNMLRFLRYLRIHADVNRRDSIAKAMNMLSRPYADVHLQILNIHAHEVVSIYDTAAQSHTWRQIAVSSRKLPICKSGTDVHDFITRWTNLLHPNLIELFGVIEDMGSCIAITPSYKGTHILGYLAQARDANKHKLLEETASALNYLHQSGICHGALRADNILISEIGTVKLHNFGRLFTDRDDINPPDGIRWKSPEAIADGLYNTASDIYSLGVTMWEIISNRHPWQDLGNADARAAILLGKTLSLEADVFNNVYSSIMQLSWHFEARKRPSAFQICWILNGFTNGNSNNDAQFSQQSFDDVTSLLQQ